MQWLKCRVRQDLLINAPDPPPVREDTDGKAGELTEDDEQERGGAQVVEQGVQDESQGEKDVKFADLSRWLRCELQ